MSRLIKDILIEADQTRDLQHLVNLWNEIAKNKYQYSLYEIRNANKHIRDIALNSNASDLDKGKFYMYLQFQFE